MKQMTIEKEMRYCVSCRDEYRPGIEKCGVCGADLVSGAELLDQKAGQLEALRSRKGPLTDRDEVVTVLKATMAEVRRIESLLLADKIGTRIVGDGPSCGKGCCGGGEVELQVRREEALEAIAIIEKDFDRVTAIDSHSTAYADYGFDPNRNANTCPACGTAFSGSLTCPDCGLCFG